MSQKKTTSKRTGKKSKAPRPEVVDRLISEFCKPVKGLDYQLLSKQASEKAAMEVRGKKVTKDQNAEAINRFFSMYGKETKARFSEFIFQRLAEYAKYNEGDTADYRDSNVFNFKMLSGLVSKLQPVN